MRRCYQLLVCMLVISPFLRSSRAEACGSGTYPYWPDADGDGYGVGEPDCEPAPPTGWAEAGGDCNDNNDAINPGATEVCNGINDDCDGQTDEGVTTTYYQDSDGDGFGKESVTTQACSQPSGYATGHPDCDDDDNTIYPGAVEVCNEKDDDCDWPESVDEGLDCSVYGERMPGGWRRGSPVRLSQGISIDIAEAAESPTPPPGGCTYENSNDCMGQWFWSSIRRR